MNDNISGGLNIISNKAPYLNPALKKIADYILDNKEKCKTITTKDLATACGVAESTVTRFVKELGFNSFQELKISIAEQLTLSETENQQFSEESYIYEDIKKSDNTNDIINKIFYKNIQKMTKAKDLINVSELEKAVDAIEKAENIIIACTGSSTVSATEALMRFTRTGKRCSYYNDFSVQLMNASTSSINDVVIGISDSGRTITVVETLNIAKKRGATTIGITSESNSPLTKHCDIILYTPERNKKSLTASHWESTSSKTAQILIIDILYACVVNKQYDENLKNLNKTFEALKITRENN